MIYNIIVITKFHEKLRKSSFMFFSEIQIIKDDCKKRRNGQIFKYQGSIILNDSFKISNLDSLGVKVFLRNLESFG